MKALSLALVIIALIAAMFGFVVINREEVATGCMLVGILLGFVLLAKVAD